MSAENNAAFDGQAFAVAFFFLFAAIVIAKRFGLLDRRAEKLDRWDALMFGVAMVGSIAFGSAVSLEPAQRGTFGLLVAVASFSVRRSFVSREKLEELVYEEVPQTTGRQILGATLIGAGITVILFGSFVAFLALAFLTTVKDAFSIAPLKTIGPRARARRHPCDRWLHDRARASALDDRNRRAPAPGEIAQGERGLRLQPSVGTR